MSAEDGRYQIDKPQTGECGVPAKLAAETAATAYRYGVNNMFTNFIMRLGGSGRQIKEPLETAGVLTHDGTDTPSFFTLKGFWMGYEKHLT